MASRHLHRSMGSGLASWHGDSRTDGTEHDTHLINTLHEPSVTPCATRGSRELVLARVVDGQEDVDRHLIARGPGFLSANTKQQLSGLSSLRPARTKHSDQTARDAKADLHSERSSTHLLEPILAPIRPPSRSKSPRSSVSISRLLRRQLGHPPRHRLPNYTDNRPVIVSSRLHRPPRPSRVGQAESIVSSPLCLSLPSL
jgi:hypothetical protein